MRYDEPDDTYANGTASFRSYDSYEGYDESAEYDEASDDEMFDDADPNRYADDDGYEDDEDSYDVADDDGYEDDEDPYGDAYDDEEGDDCEYSIFRRMAEDGDAMDEMDYGDDVEDDRQEQEYEDDVGDSGFLGFLGSNDFALYLALLILPPVGIWLLWRRNRYDVSLRTALSAGAAIWFIVLLILLFSKTAGNQQDITMSPAASNLPGFSDPQTGTPSPSPSPTPTPKPSTTPRTSASATTTPTPSSVPSSNPNAPVSYVYVMNNGTYYHSASNCTNITGQTSRITIDAATTRGMTACPKCYGATTTGTTYYCTDRGTWYHVDKTCQDMKNPYEVTESAAILKGKTACPTCIGYFGTPGGKYYHCYSNCTGPNSNAEMKGAVSNTKDYWESNNKTPCPKCMATPSATKTSANTATTTYVYGRQDGTRFHTDPDCDGMKNARHITIAVAAANGLKACPICVTPDKLYVFARLDGERYHTKATCDGMKNAQRVTAKAAIEKGKVACSICASMLIDAATPSGSSAPGSAQQYTYVYCTPGGERYHVDDHCDNMKDATLTTITAAVSAGKKYCTKCISPSNLYVFARSDSTSYHTDSTCSGMKNAQRVTWQYASTYGKTACPICASMLANQTPIRTTTPSPVPGANEKYTYVYYTPGGKRYHLDEHCDNMQGAARAVITAAANAGKNYCTKCISPSKLYVFARPDGTWYHTDATCSSMENAQRVTLQYAANYGKIACPVCAGMLVGVVTPLTPTPTPTPTPSPVGTTPPATGTSENYTYVYYNPGGTSYHVDPTCQNMTGAIRAPIAVAVNAGKKYCTRCITPSNVQVFARLDAPYYHTDAACGGMQNAQKITAKTAIDFGKSACPVCARMFPNQVAPSITLPPATTSPTNTTSASADTTVFLVLNDAYATVYHAAAKCAGSGATGGTGVTLQFAIRSGYNACPYCRPPAKVA